MKALKTCILLFAVFIAGTALAQEQKSAKASESKAMKTYLVERTIPDASKLSVSDLQDISQKSCSILKSMGPSIQWLNSYVLDDKVYCVYKAESKELIEEHAEKGKLPCDNIWEVKTNIGPFTAEGKTF